MSSYVSGQAETTVNNRSAEVLEELGTPAISVCITTRGRAELLDACLAGLASQVGAPIFELLVCCQADPGAAAIVRRRFPGAVVGLVDSAYPGGARNFLIQHASGDLLLFLDDDVEVPRRLLARLHQLAQEHPSVAVFGGPNLTAPTASEFQIVQGAILGSLLATGPVRRRYGRHPAGPADERFFTLCNMAVRRSAMLPFPPTLAGGEENAVLYELAIALAPMHYDPDLYVFHERRPSLVSFLRQLEKYGRGRGQVLARRPRSCRPVHLMALAQPAWLVSLPVVGVLWSPWYLLSAALYALALLAAGAAVAIGMKNIGILRRLRVALLGALLTAAVHTFYGVGVLHGLLHRHRVPNAHWRPVPSPDPT